MKKFLILTLLVTITSLVQAQDVVWSTFTDNSNNSIKKIIANNSTGATTGSFNGTININASAALGVNTWGWLYYLEYGSNATGNGNGSVTVRSVKTDGTTGSTATFDVNGSSNSDPEFVRLGISQGGTAYIIAKNASNSTIRLSSFTTNSTGAITGFTDKGFLSTSDNTNDVFENGDLAFDGTGKLYVLANNGSGTTKIYTLNSANLASATSSTTTTLSYRWTLKKSDGSDFSNRVNGFAFASFGSVYISSDDGLYFLDQFSVNFAGSGTVKAVKVKNESNMTDLATAYWPAQTTLPVKFVSFNVTHLYGNEFEVAFTVGEAQDVDRFTVTVSEDGRNFKSALIIFPDALNPNTSYKVKVTIK
jgi:hypothetical protein